MPDILLACPLLSQPRAMLAAMNVTFDAELWAWEARQDSWVFAALPAAASDEILDRAGGATRGFGSLRVRAELGSSTWLTSIFPDAGRRTYVLPVKKAVRKAQRVGVGDIAEISITLVDL